MMPAGHVALAHCPLCGAFVAGDAGIGHDCNREPAPEDVCPVCLQPDGRHCTTPHVYRKPDPEVEPCSYCHEPHGWGLPPLDGYRT